MNKTAVALGVIAGIVILIIYFVNLAYVQGPTQQRHNDHWEEQAKTAPENFLLVCPPSHDGKPIAPEQCKRSGQYEYERKQQMLDHKAQISMKRASWVTAFFTGFGLLLVGITLIQAFKAAGLAADVLSEAENTAALAKESLDDTKIATAAANKTTKLTSEQLDIAKAEQRPWIGIEDLKVKKIVTLNVGLPDECREVKISLKATNFGKFPAHDIVCQAIISEWNVIDEIISNLDPKMGFRGFGSKISIGPSASKRITEDMVTGFIHETSQDCSEMHIKVGVPQFLLVVVYYWQADRCFITFENHQISFGNNNTSPRPFYSMSQMTLKNTILVQRGGEMR